MLHKKHNKIRQVYLFHDSDLPFEGWLQSCFNCCQITSKCLLYKIYKTNNKTYEIYFYLCKDCKRDLFKNESNTALKLDFFNKSNISRMHIHFGN